MYDYDNSGNLLTKSVINMTNDDIIKTDTYQYSNNNWEDQLTKFNDINITYDEIGNPITIGNSITLGWINGRSLNSYVDGTKNLDISYKYNIDGIRTSKIVNGIETKYYLENSNIIYEEKGNNRIYYLYDAVGLIGLQYNNNTYYYIKNLQGDIVGILDSNYNKVVSYKYDSWGKLLSIKDNQGNEITDPSNIGIINPFRYREYYYDTETELYYLNSRYYDPEINRFISTDTKLIQDFSFLGNNLYLYTANNPINRIDNGGNSWKSFLNSLKKKINNFVSDVCYTAVGTLAYILGRKQTARTIWNSIGDKPKNLTNKDLPGIEKQIKSSKIFKDTISDIANETPNGSIEKASKLKFKIGPFSDLGLSLHRTTMNVSGDLIDGKGILNIVITDTYDFKYETLSKNASLKDIFINYSNNLAYCHQELGHINPYDIRIEFKYEVK